MGEVHTMRLPFGPVERRVGLARRPVDDFAEGGIREYGTCRSCAEQLGVTMRTVIRYRKDGLSLDQADRVAFALGLHPFDLWASDYYALVDA